MQVGLEDGDQDLLCGLTEPFRSKGVLEDIPELFCDNQALHDLRRDQTLRRVVQDEETQYERKDVFRALLRKRQVAVPLRELGLHEEQCVPDRNKIVLSRGRERLNCKDC